MIEIRRAFFGLVLVPVSFREPQSVFLVLVPVSLHELASDPGLWFAVFAPMFGPKLVINFGPRKNTVWSGTEHQRGGEAELNSKHRQNTSRFTSPPPNPRILGQEYLRKTNERPP